MAPNTRVFVIIGNFQFELHSYVYLYPLPLGKIIFQYLYNGPLNWQTCVMYVEMVDVHVFMCIFHFNYNCFLEKPTVYMILIFLNWNPRIGQSDITFAARNLLKLFHFENLSLKDSWDITQTRITNQASCSVPRLGVLSVLSSLLFPLYLASTTICFHPASQFQTGCLPPLVVSTLLCEFLVAMVMKVFAFYLCVLLICLC